jgi:hypothetical protein
MYAGKKAVYVLGRHDYSTRKLGWLHVQDRCVVSLYLPKQPHTNPSATDEIVAQQSRLVKKALQDSGPYENFTVSIPEVCHPLDFAASSRSLWLGPRKGTSHYTGLVRSPSS